MLPDNDEELLEAFFAGKLPISATCEVAARLQGVPALRSHLVDMVTMRALLQPAARARLKAMTLTCLDARALFARHQRGGVTAAEIARLSLHFASCHPCDLACAFGVAAAEAPGGGRWYAPRSVRGRVTLLAATLAVGGLGGAGWRWTSVGAASSEVNAAATSTTIAPAVAPRTTVAPEALAALIRRLRSVDAMKPYADLIERLPQTPDPQERNRLYGRMMRLPRTLDEDAMWTIADAEPDPHQRRLTYSLTPSPQITDTDRWLAALKRERAESSPEGVDTLAVLMKHLRRDATKPLMLERLTEAGVREWRFATEAIAEASAFFPDDPEVNAAVERLSRSPDPGTATFALRSVARYAKTRGDTARVRSAVREISAYVNSPDQVIRKVAAECVESLAPDDMIIGLFKGANLTDEILRETLRAIADRRKITIPID